MQKDEFFAFPKAKGAMQIMESECETKLQFRASTEVRKYFIKTTAEKNSEQNSFLLLPSANIGRKRKKGKKLL